jgi:hypothetical protein
MSESYPVESTEKIPSPNSSNKICLLSPSSHHSRIKLKKDALEQVDFQREFQHDPKYKTELCKSWSESEFCAYGNKCRFAHGKHELFDKIINCKKYKQKECMSFFKNNYCSYGSRCHFKHEERRLGDIERSYYTYLNQINDWDSLDLDIIYMENGNGDGSSFFRLPVFQSIQDRATKEDTKTIFSNHIVRQEYSRKDGFFNKNEFKYSRSNLFSLNYYTSTQLF